MAAPWGSLGVGRSLPPGPRNPHRDLAGVRRVLVPEARQQQLLLSSCHVVHEADRHPPYASRSKRQVHRQQPEEEEDHAGVQSDGASPRRPPCGQRAPRTRLAEDDCQAGSCQKRGEHQQDGPHGNPDRKRHARIEEDGKPEEERIRDSNRGKQHTEDQLPDVGEGMLSGQVVPVLVTSPVSVGIRHRLSARCRRRLAAHDTDGVAVVRETGGDRRRGHTCRREQARCGSIPCRVPELRTCQRRDERDASLLRVPSRTNDLLSSRSPPASCVVEWSKRGDGFALLQGGGER